MRFLTGVLFVAGGIAACFEQPSYVGRLCSEDAPCPGGLSCIEQRCSDRLAEPDAGIDAGAAPDATAFPDATPPDATVFPDATVDAAMIEDAGADAGFDSGEPPHPVQISTRNKHDLLLMSDGTVWGWGWNEAGQVEGAPYTERRSPVKIAIADVTRIAAGGVMSFALTSDGNLHAWGRNRAGELGDGMSGLEQSPVPTVVRGRNGSGSLMGVRDFAAGYDFAIVLLEDGTVWSFGSNTVFQLGRTDVTSSAVPVQVEGLDQVEKIAAGAYHGVALRSDRSVWAWGYNEYGQLGRGTNMNSLAAAAAVHGVNDVGFLGDVVEISAGWGHTIAVVQGGSVYAWGWNASGQLGDDTFVDRAYPAVVLNTSGLGPLSNIVDVRAGFTFNLARTATEDLYGFGFNMFAQLGDGTSATRSLPAPVMLMNGTPIGSVSSFAAGGDNAMALTRDRVLWTWGSNMFGEIGDGLMNNVAHPQVLPLPD